METAIKIQTAGRICLFGDHQDYLRLPVIACAIDRFVFLSSELNTDAQFNIRMPDINEERTIAISETFEALKKGDHLGATLRVARRYGCVPDRGFDIEIKSTLPINAGVSSSSAVVVTWTNFLLRSFGCDHVITPHLIAQIAYEAEVLEQNSPGGNMDQYTVAIGGVLFINTGKDFSVLKLDTKLNGLVLGVSGIPKQTIGLLGELREKAQAAVSEIKKSNPRFELNKAEVRLIPLLSQKLSSHLTPYFEAAVKNHAITREALLEFRKEKPNLVSIGRLMNAHHEVLKNLLKITVPKIDAMIDAALAAGAYGAKIVGSGGGGSIVALAADDNIDAVKQAIMDASAIDAYEVQVAKGTRVISA